jgi:hypothetical protein
MWRDWESMFRPLAAEQSQSPWHFAAMLSFKIRDFCEKTMPPGSAICPHCRQPQKSDAEAAMIARSSWRPCSRSGVDHLEQIQWLARVPHQLRRINIHVHI